MKKILSNFLLVILLTSCSTLIKPDPFLSIQSEVKTIQSGKNYYAYVTNGFVDYLFHSVFNIEYVINSGDTIVFRCEGNNFYQISISRIRDVSFVESEDSEKTILKKFYSWKTFDLPRMTSNWEENLYLRIENKEYIRWAYYPVIKDIGPNALSSVKVYSFIEGDYIVSISMYIIESNIKKEKLNEFRDLYQKIKIVNKSDIDINLLINAWEK